MPWVKFLCVVGMFHWKRLCDKFWEKNFTFRIVDNTVVIRPEEMKPDPVKQQVVKGVVVDVQGLPLPGVTVLLKGTTLGTSTDMDGNFTLSFPHTAGSVLQFSFHRNEND